MRNLAAIKVKANAHYQCQECGSTELIQAHHQIPGDDNRLIVLCAECHSRKHPDVPRALFFSTSNQPYWQNKSASTLAKELGVHSRTVIRAAKRLEILPGELSPWDEELIRNNIPKLVRILTRKCPRCGCEWQGRKTKVGKTICPQCERNKLLQEYARTHSDLSLKEIGEIFNISESRVWRVLHGNKNRQAAGGEPAA